MNKTLNEPYVTLVYNAKNLEKLMFRGMLTLYHPAVPFVSYILFGFQFIIGLCI